MNDVYKTICTGIAQTLPKNVLKHKLASGKTLNVKLGMDPTAPDLHLGHMVVLRKLKQFQDAGHNVIFIIGDFTARIGDPTGKSQTRPPLTQEEIEHNMQTYLSQVGRIIDIEKAEIRQNSQWLDKLSSADLIKLAGKVTLARITERDDFKKRIEQNRAIGLHELFYPLMQAYDSVVLNADVELGGTDQTFNLLMGRFLQEQFDQSPQAILTVPLLEGLDGVQKMSKSLGNAIGITEQPDQAFGKLMSISDTLMWRYFSLLLNVSDERIAVMQKEVADGIQHPMKLKKTMAHDIVAEFWSHDDAKQAQQQFEAVFEQRDYAQAQKVVLPIDVAQTLWLVDLLKALGAIKTTSEGKRLIEAGAVHIDGIRVIDFKLQVSWVDGTIVKVGKHRLYNLSR